MRFLSRCLLLKDCPDSSLTKQLPFSCQLNRMAAYLECMQVMFDNVYKLQASTHPIELDLLKSQLHTFSQWIEDQKLKLSLEQIHQHKESTVDATNNLSLESSSSSNQIELHRLELLKLPIYSPNRLATKNTILQSETLSGEIEMLPFKRNVQADKAELLGSAAQSNHLLSTPSSSGVTSKALASIIERNRKLQDDLSTDLAFHAEQLKLNSLLFQNKLEMDAKVLEETDEQLGHNLIRLQRERKSIKAFTSKSWGTTFLIWGSIIVVILLAMFTFMVMQVARPVRRYSHRTTTIKTTSSTTTSIHSIPPDYYFD
ncbi:hypothetical protein O5D80_004056 [Batrachochytrium dendrobatidis]|nr:hypothetical protein O5D80_004056 [Batrachochytrium dendrobatidis]